ncbi:MAG TPA: DUF3570 domain-containing protein [bacterium]|jgi:hypothetical protein
MQLRNRLRTATCALLAVAGTAAAEGTWQAEAGALGYSEAGRVSVFEPLARIKRTLPNGQWVAAKMVIDAMTGASPNGAMPTDHPQTFTSASSLAQSQRNRGDGEGEGRGPTVVAPGATPLLPFQDHRVALDLEYERPLLRTLKADIGAHISGERDYISRGTTLSFSWDTPDRLTTFTAAGGANFDLVQPVGGKPKPYDLYAVTTRYGNGDKTVLDGMAGITRILSRRWLMQFNYGYGRDKGYLTEPYKLVSILLPSGSTTDYRYENRPDLRTRQDAYLNSVYQFGEDVLRTSYRYYWDTWGVKSHTADVKYRFELPHSRYLEPHVRYYTQTAADFHTFGLMDGAPLPAYATSDYRYGHLATTTIGLKYGVPTAGGELNFRAEYMRQSGDSHPSQAVGVQKNYDLFPSVNILILQIGYSRDF